MFCSQCGKPLDGGFRFCPWCGAAAAVPPPAPPAGTHAPAFPLRRSEPGLYDTWYAQDLPEPAPVPAVPAPAVPLEDPRIAPMKRAFNLNTLATLVVFAVQSEITTLAAVLLVLLFLTPGMFAGDPLNTIIDVLTSWNTLFEDSATSTLAEFAYAAAYTLSMGLGILISGLLRRRVRPVRIERHALPFGQFVLAALVTFGAWGVGVLLGNWPYFVAPVDTSSAPDESAAVLLMSIIGAPLFEELIFRKFLIDRLLPFGERTTVVFTALLFGMAHQNAGQFFLAFFVGLVLARVYIRTGNILYTMLLHCMINTFASADTIGCRIFGDGFDYVWLALGGALMLAGIVTMAVCRKHPLFVTELNYIPGANRAAFRCWGMTLCKVIVTVEIVAFGLLMALSAEADPWPLGLVHLVSAAGAVAVIFAVAGRTSRRVAAAPAVRTGSAQNVTEP